MFKEHIIYIYLNLIMALKHKGSEAGDLDVPKRTQKVLPLSENVKVLNITTTTTKTICLGFQDL